MKSIMTAAAVAALLAAPAFAQSTTTTTPPSPTTPPASTTSPSTTPTMPKAADGMFYTKRAEWHASKLMGAKVQNTAGETIGDINDVLLDADGKVAAVVIGVGGFLGVGERNAAVSFASLQFSRDASNNPVVRVNATKEQLKSAPEWKSQTATTN